MTTEPTEQTPLQTPPRFWPKRIFYGWAIVGTGFIAAFGMVPMFGPVLGVFFESIQEELGWSRTQIAFAFTLGSMTSSIGTFVFGRVLDRYGARAIVVIAGIIVVLAMVGISFMQAPWQFWILFGLGRGSALGGIQIGIGISVAHWFVKKRPRAVAIRQSGLRAGQFVFPLLIVGIMSFTDWRDAWRILAVLTGILIIVPGYVYLRRRPEDLGMYPDGERPDPDAAPTGGRFSRNVRDISWTLAEARRTRAFWMVVLFVSVDRFALGAINLHMTIRFQDQGLTLVQSASIVSLFTLVSALTGLPWGLVMEKIHIRWGAMLISLLLLLSMIVLIAADNYPMAIVFGLLFGFANGGASLVEGLLFADYFGREHQGAIRGFTAPFRIASPIGPTLTGYIHDRTGSYNLAYMIFSGIFLVMLVAMVFASPPVKRPAVESAEQPEA
ncbi:MAG: MFS transporter [Dehalococcoidia bacterium]